MFKKLRQGIDNDPLIKDQMTYLGCFLRYTLRDYLAPVLVAAHTLKNLDRGAEPENKDYKSVGP